MDIIFLGRIEMCSGVVSQLFFVLLCFDYQ